MLYSPTLLPFQKKGRSGEARGREHVHRLQPGLPGPHLQDDDCELPREPRRGLRTGTVAAASQQGPRVSPTLRGSGRRRTGGACRRLHRRRAWTRRHVRFLAFAVYIYSFVHMCVRLAVAPDEIATPIFLSIVSLLQRTVHQIIRQC